MPILACFAMSELWATEPVATSLTFVPATPLHRPAPEYPKSAQVRGKEGWVEMSFCIDSVGLVADPIVRYSSGDAVFERLARATVETWRYEPAVLDGRAVDQCFNSVMLAFSLDPIVQGARPSFVRNWKRVGTLIDEGRLEEAEAALSAIEPWNNYESARVLLRRADIERARGRTDHEAMALAVALRLPQYLEEDAARAVRLRLFHLHVAAGQFAAALAQYDSLADDADALNESERRVGEALREALQSDASIVTPMRLDVACPDGSSCASVSLLRRRFGFDDAVGEFERFELRCETKRYVSTVAAENTWLVPASWGACELFVFGATGAEIRLREFADAPSDRAPRAQSEPGAEAPPASAATTAD
jgi:TonB family protein